MATPIDTTVQTMQQPQVVTLWFHLASKPTAVHVEVPENKIIQYAVEQALLKMKVHFSVADVIVKFHGKDIRPGAPISHYNNTSDNDPLLLEVPESKERPQAKRIKVDLAQQGLSQLHGGDSGVPDYAFKIVLIGNSAVGKTSLLYQFTENRFPLSIPTIGTDFGVKVVTTTSKLVKLQVWDTGGQEKFNSITRSYYHGAAGALLVYDISRRETYDTLTKWLHEVQAFATSKLVIVLVGNKNDVGRKVTFKEANTFAQKNELPYFETSAKTDENVEEAFLECTRLILSKIESGEVNPEEHPGVRYGNEHVDRNDHVDLNACADSTSPRKSKCGKC